MNIDAALAFDRSHIWHPYASIGNPPPVNFAVSAKGTQITLADGSELTDAVSSWWCVAHGHDHPAIVKAIREQAEKMTHVMFAGFTHGPAVELAERLCGFLPAGLDKIFFADSGSIAVEVAAKMAVQYQHAKGFGKKCKLVALKGAYHGDTAGAMALSDPDGMHVLFRGIMPHHYFAEKPRTPFAGRWDASDTESLERTVAEHGDEIAAVICEPIFQGGNAMWLYHANYLREIRRICTERGILMIADEIASGFYRTGKRFACEHAGVTPDIICVGKALTGGSITLAATVASESVADVISHGNPGAFMHGPTYMGNALACAAGVASLRLFAESDYAEKVKGIEKGLAAGLAPCRALPNVTDVRVLGAIGVVEVAGMPAPADIRRVIRETGVWLRPFGNYIYTMPPLITPPETVGKICRAMQALAQCEPGPETDDGGFHE